MNCLTIVQQMRGAEDFDGRHRRPQRLSGGSTSRTALLLGRCRGHYAVASARGTGTQGTGQGQLPQTP